MKTQVTENKTYYYGVTEENPIVVDDYPWGFRMRTKQRYWIETKASHGQRLCYQTLNPKTNKWCKPKKCTYSSNVILVKLHENGHIKTTDLERYADKDQVQAFLDLHGDYLEGQQLANIKNNLLLKEAYSKAIDAAEEKAKLPKTSLNMGSKLLWTKEEIIKSPDNLLLYSITLQGQAIKKRCRKKDFYYKTLFFTDRKATLSEQDIEMIKAEALAHCRDNLRSFEGLRIVLRKTEFKAPTPESPMFRSFVEMLSLRHDNVLAVI